MSYLKTIAGAQKIPPIFLILVLGLLHGSIYIFVVPPWQHYDEPTQFEYAWLIANKGKLPELDHYDSIMRREVAASMVEHNFFQNLPAPNLLLDKPWIGISQTGDRPLYYIVQAIPLWFLKGSDVTFQMYANRVLSVAMFLGTLWIGYKLTCEIFPNHRVFGWLIPLAMALTPSFVDLMSAINNDVGATLIFSTFLWVGVRIILKGISLLRIFAFLLLAVGCLLTKSTVYLAIPSAFLLLLFAILQSKTDVKKFAWPVIWLILIFAGLFLFSWKDAAFWYRNQVQSQQALPTRSQNPQASTGYVLQIQYTPGEKNELNLHQPLSFQSVSLLAGKKYTLAGWVWASQPLDIQAPTLAIDGAKSSQTLSLTQSPTFFAVRGEIPHDVRQLNIWLDPLIEPGDNSLTIYYDDLVLVEGEFPTENLPTLSEDKMKGTWGNKDMVNLVRNPSAERRWVTFQPRWLAEYQIHSVIPDYALPAMQDTNLTFDNYRLTTKNLLESYWAKFGWNHVSLPNSFYILLRWFTLFGVAGFLFGLVRRLALGPGTSTFLTVWLAGNTILIWVAALARQTLPFWESAPFTPSARYAYPAVIPTTMVIMLGWYFLGTRYKPLRVLAYLPIAILVILDITSLVTIIRFYTLG